MQKDDELINKIFFKKYKIIKKIGKGSFGLVYLGKIINSNNFVAVKFEPKNQTDLILERESYLLYYLRGFGIPEVITYGHNSQYNILIQTLLGNSTNSIFIRNNKKFSMKDCCMLGIQMIDRLEYIHSKYIIHRDIKPDNFLVGNPDTSIIYIIDFGLAKKFMSSRTGKHAKFAINKKWSGTSRFASANSLRGVVQSRRDDLESLCYVLLFFMKGNLPWDNVFGCNENEDILLIYKIKKYMKPELLFLNLPQEAIDFFKYCKKLDFQQKPDYNYLRSLLLNILNYMNEKNDLNFSWINYNKNVMINNQREPLSFKYKNSYKRKASPQQRIYNSLLNKNIHLDKRSESFNEIFLNEEVNKVKRDWQPIKNISPSPLPIIKINNLFSKEKKEKIKSKKIPKVKKKIILNNNNLKRITHSEKIILKSPTQVRNEEKNYRRINIIPFQSFGNKIIKNNSYNKNNNNVNNRNENNKNKIISKGSYFNNNLKNMYNHIVTRKNNSFNGLGDNTMVLPIKYSPTYKEYKRLVHYDKNNDIKNNNHNENYFNCYKKYHENNSLQDFPFNQNIKNKKSLVLSNSFLNNLQKSSYSNLLNNNKNKIIKENSSLNMTNSNIIMIPKKLQFTHISPEQFNRFKTKYYVKKSKNNLFELNKNNYIQYRNNKMKLNLNKNNKSNFVNKLNKDAYSMNATNIPFKPNREIRIINIISPINRTSTYYKVEKNSFSSKKNLYKFTENNNFQLNNNLNNKNDMIINNFYNNKLNKNEILSDYYSNASIIGNYKGEESQFMSNNDFKINSYENSLNNGKGIFKTNSCFMANKYKSYSKNNFSKIKLEKVVSRDSLSYISPKSVEKFKNNIQKKKNMY